MFSISKLLKLQNFYISKSNQSSFIINVYSKKFSTKYNVILSEEVAEALKQNKPIVALESTIISHGMPYPRNIEIAKLVEDKIRSYGCTPATIAILNGQCRVGLTVEDLEILGNSKINNVIKASRRDIAYCIAHQLNAATTVASTMILAHAAGIKVFATGGIGGVHRGAEETMDISADLIELGSTPVTVVCAGVKSILDIPKTLEYLETHGVPVLSYQSDIFPAFFTNNSGCKSPLVAEDCISIAKMMKAAENLGLKHGFIVAVPNDNPADSNSIQEAIEYAINKAKDNNIIGHAVTPFILKTIEERTKGKSLDSNISLVLNNAKIASQIAIEYNKIKQFYRKDVLENVELNRNNKTLFDANVIVIGGAVVDMVGTLTSKFINKSSNPGIMKMSIGGVGFNIANHLSNSLKSISMLTSLGNDNSGEIILDTLTSIGIDTSSVLLIDKQTTATYTAIHESNGDLVVGLADMDIFRMITPDYISSEASLLKTADIVVVDGNISSSSFNFMAKLCKKNNIPLVFEPTSDHKCTLPIISEVMSCLDIVKPNISELIEMIRCCIKYDLISLNIDLIEYVLSTKLIDDMSVIDIKLLSQSLLSVMLNNSDKQLGNRRVHGKHLIVSMGAQGVLWCRSNDASMENSNITHIEAIPLAYNEKLTHTNGAGDAFLAGVIESLFNKEICPFGTGPNIESIKHGLRKAKMHLITK